MARALITGLSALVPDDEGVNHAREVFLVLDTDTGELTGYLDSGSALADTVGTDTPEGGEQ